MLLHRPLPSYEEATTAADSSVANNMGGSSRRPMYPHFRKVVICRARGYAISISCGKRDAATPPEPSSKMSHSFISGARLLPCWHLCVTSNKYTTLPPYGSENSSFPLQILKTPGLQNRICPWKLLLAVIYLICGVLHFSRRE